MLSLKVCNTKQNLVNGNLKCDLNLVPQKEFMMIPKPTYNPQISLFVGHHDSKINPN